MTVQFNDSIYGTFTEKVENPALWEKLKAGNWGYLHDYSYRCNSCFAGGKRDCVKIALYLFPDRHDRYDVVWIDSMLIDDIKYGCFAEKE